MRVSQQLIADGVLGEVRSVRAAFGAAFPQDGSSRWMPGGSTLLDQGIYPVTLAHMLLGRPETVSARGTVRADGVDLREDFSLGYADARFAQGASSMVEWIDPSAAVSGTDAYVTIAGGFWWASQLTIHHPLPWGQRRQESSRSSGRATAMCRCSAPSSTPSGRALSSIRCTPRPRPPRSTRPSTRSGVRSLGDRQRHRSASVPSVIVSTSSPGSTTKRFSSSQKPSSSPPRSNDTSAVAPAATVTRRKPRRRCTGCAIDATGSAR